MSKETTERREMAVPVETEGEDASILVVPSNRQIERRDKKCSEEKCSEKTISMLKRKLSEKSQDHRTKTKKRTCRSKETEPVSEMSLPQQVDADRTASDLDHHEQTHRDSPIIWCSGKAINMTNITDDRLADQGSIEVGASQKLFSTSQYGRKTGSSTASGVSADGDQNLVANTTPSVLPIGREWTEHRRERDNRSVESMASEAGHDFLEEDNRLRLVPELGRKDGLTSPGNLPNLQDLDIVTDNDTKKALARKIKSKSMANSADPD